MEAPWPSSFSAVTGSSPSPCAAAYFRTSSVRNPRLSVTANMQDRDMSPCVTVDNDPASGVVVYVFPDIEAGLVPMRRSP